MFSLLSEYVRIVFLIVLHPRNTKNDGLEFGRYRISFLIGKTVNRPVTGVVVTISFIGPQGNFGADLKRMGSILSDCVTQVKGIQVRGVERRVKGVSFCLPIFGGDDDDDDDDEHEDVTEES